MDLGKSFALLYETQVILFPFSSSRCLSLRRESRHRLVYINEVRHVQPLIFQNQILQRDRMFRLQKSQRKYHRWPSPHFSLNQNTVLSVLLQPVFFCLLY